MPLKAVRPTPRATNVAIRPWHSLPAEEVMRALETPPDGLSTAEATRRLAEFGPNQLASKGGPPPWRVFLRQFQSPLIYILLIAAAVSFLVGKRFDVYVILGVVVINAMLGFIQEERAASALAALQRLTSPHAHVVREGEVHEVLATEVVPGDLLVLEAGDRVAADARLFKTAELVIDESALTGESVPVPKTPDPVPGGDEVPLGDRTGLAFMNSVVTAGRARAVVVATGMATEMGKIAEGLAGGPSETPIQRRLAAFSKRLGQLILLVVAAVFLVGLIQGRSVTEMFFVAISLAVSSIPEGLPIVVSVLFAIGVNRMARRKALIRRLPAVEALGSATVICSDKTGTLTRNEMTVREVSCGDDRFAVEGEGYRPVGRLLRAGRPVTVGDHDGLYWLAACARLCNDALLVEEESGEWKVLGDPTEGALQVLGEKAGFKEDWERIGELPFSSERKWMATLNRTPEGGRVAFIKGATDRILSAARGWLDGEGVEHPADDAFRRRVEARAEELASEALRVLALGMIRDDGLITIHPEVFAERVTFLGLVGMIDPERPEAVAAVRTCQEAGIRVVMITGDHMTTGRAIARRLGIVAADAAEPGIDGVRLAAMSDRELEEAVGRTALYGRVAPEHKLRIVTALQRQGEIVAMTGDGVNDAPALSQADIGVSMGLAGTEVAKGASDMVLADDNFATIVAAVEEGRTIADNLHKVIHYLLTTSTAEILIIAVALLLGMPLPLAAVQILWVNLATDGLMDKALALEKPEPGLMSRPPAAANAPIVSAEAFRRMLLLGSVTALGTLGSYAWELWNGGTFRHAQTEAFTTLVAYQWFSAFAYRSERVPIWRLPMNWWMVGTLLVGVLLQTAAVYAPPLQLVLGTEALSLAEFADSALIAASVLVVSEAYKIVRERWVRTSP